MLLTGGGAAAEGDRPDLAHYYDYYCYFFSKLYGESKKPRIGSITGFRGIRSPCFRLTDLVSDRGCTGVYRGRGRG